MTKLVRYLQQHIIGQALETETVRTSFATDASIFALKPIAVVFPKNEQDVRRAVRFLWQLAERGGKVSLTARGGGTDFTGASIGSGLVMDFTAHMNRIMSYDSRRDVLEVEVGARLDRIQQVFNVQYRFLPVMPALDQLATVGGSIANNSGGCYSEKYGLFGNYVKGLRVVLANGEVITVERLSKRGLDRKLGLANFEGQIYRQLDSLLTESAASLEASVTSAVNTKFNLEAIRAKDGSFSLLPLFIGSQGTLGLITQAKLTSASHNTRPMTCLLAVEDINTCLTIVADCKKLKPAALEMVNPASLKQIKRLSPMALKDVVSTTENFVLLVEFDDLNQGQLKRKLKQIKLLAEKLGATLQLAETEIERASLWRVRHAVSYILTDTSTKGRPIPLIENASVPSANWAKFYTEAEALLKKFQLPFLAWGHIGLGQISLMPKFDLSEVSASQRAIKLLTEYQQLLASHGGSLNGCHNSGRLRSHFAPDELGVARAELDSKVKQILDPYNIFNPDVKVVADKSRLSQNIANSYEITKTYPGPAWF